MTNPHLLICSTPVYGHVMPLRAIARSLIQRSYPVTFLTGTDYRSAIESIGATFVPLEGEADLTQERVDSGYKGVDKGDPAGLQPSRAEEQQDYFVSVIEDQFHGVQKALRNIQRTSGRETQVVVLVEGWFKGVLPKILGAGDVEDGLRVEGYVGVGIIPVAVSSVDTAPFGPGSLPDGTEEGRKKNRERHIEDQEIAFAKSQKGFRNVLKNLGARDTDLFIRDANYHLLNQFVQMCTPSFEYPRSDAPTTLIFAGGLPVGLRDPSPKLPDWWGDITGKGERKVIFVAQGTVSMNPNDLIIPTMQALKDRKDIIVVVALGKNGVELPVGTFVPGNARVADFLPYDEILEYADCFVSNGGYGAIQHGLGHGVPQLVAGKDADKAENCARVSWSGVGIDLGTDKPSVRMIEAGVTSILEDSHFRRRAKEIKAEMLSYDPINVIIDSIDAIQK
ncbi:putative UDP-glucuronosyltransferase 2A3 [Bisporella sp. PMI_857]|nr:putative UDP-glucuronosyltransferase 2A3 [Bisporella sp. PMI_857]